MFYEVFPNLLEIASLEIVLWRCKIISPPVPIAIISLSQARR
jgi:hypothetical protein